MRKLVNAALLLSVLVIMAVISVMYLTGTGVRGFVLGVTNRIEKVIPPLPPPPRNGYIGSSILKDYAAPNRPVEDDLTDLSHALQNFALLVKGDSPMPLGANEEIALALLGKNRAKLAFLPKNSQALNAQGQLIDRWGTPLWFHASTGERIDIRSAGPDKKLWNSDDVHRRYDGYFLKPEELNPRSLNDAMQRGARTPRP